MLHGILKILHDTFLADHFRDTSLGLGVEWVLIEPGNLPLAVLAFSLLPAVALVEKLSEPLRVVEYGSKLGLLLLGLLSEPRVTENTQPDELWILGRARSRSPLLLLLLLLLIPSLTGRGGGAARVSDMDRQHVVVGDTKLGHCLVVGVGGDQVAVVVEMLGARWDLCVGGYGLAEGR